MDPQANSLTLEEIARRAGVSRSTVSRVINDHPNVSPAVRARILQVIAETGYQPNLAARSLASQRTRVFGLLIPRQIDSLFSDPFFPNLTLGIAQACNRYDYTVSLFLTHTPEDERKLLPRLSRPGMVDGVIVQSTFEHDPAIQSLAQGSVPFIVVGRPFAEGVAAFVDVDNIRGAYLAVEHLYQSGFRRIATITGALNTQAGRHRLAGCRQALADFGLPQDPALIAQADFTEEQGYRAARQLLAAAPDAIFAASDAMAFGALRALKEAGRRVPQEIGLIGFDDLPSASLTEPALTTIRQPIHQLGYRAVEMLIEVVEGGSPAPQIFLPELVVRQSSQR